METGTLEKLYSSVGFDSIQDCMLMSGSSPQFEDNNPVGVTTTSSSKLSTRTLDYILHSALLAFRWNLAVLASSLAFVPLCNHTSCFLFARFETMPQTNRYDSQKYLLRNHTSLSSLASRIRGTITLKSSQGWLHMSSRLPNLSFRIFSRPPASSPTLANQCLHSISPFLVEGNTVPGPQPCPNIHAKLEAKYGSCLVTIM
ncbi:hypothetical protein DFH27DRAFT_115742 [Peziza echinospora]|nr:hypothetical protein DFH27DRAFT_139532 [Peziza echinospora]KAI5795303.1 hypothetical protein DFH27DRAFT_115742 [Peziza echinospora]